MVQRPPAPIHTEVDTAGFEPLCKGSPGELCTLIGVENLRLGVHKGAFQGAKTEVTVTGDRDFPGHHVARQPVEERHQIDEPVEQANVRGIRTPDLIDARNRHLLQQVRRDLLAGPELTQARFLVDGFQAHQP